MYACRAPTSILAASSAAAHMHLACPVCKRRQTLLRAWSLPLNSPARLSGIAADMRAGHNLQTGCGDVAFPATHSALSLCCLAMPCLHTSSTCAEPLCFVTPPPASVHLVTWLPGRWPSAYPFAASTHPFMHFHTAVGLILYPTLQFTRTHKTFAFVGLSPHDFRNNLYQSLPVIANGAPVMTAEQLHVGTPHEPMVPQPLDTSS